MGARIKPRIEHVSIASWLAWPMALWSRSGTTRMRLMMRKRTQQAAAAVQCRRKQRTHRAKSKPVIEIAAAVVSEKSRMVATHNRSHLHLHHRGRKKRKHRLYHW